MSINCFSIHIKVSLNWSQFFYLLLHCFLVALCQFPYFNHFCYVHNALYTHLAAVVGSCPMECMVLSKSQVADCGSFWTSCYVGSDLKSLVTFRRDFLELNLLLVIAIKTGKKSYLRLFAKRMKKMFSATLLSVLAVFNHMHFIHCQGFSAGKFDETTVSGIRLYALWYHVLRRWFLISFLSNFRQASAWLKMTQKSSKISSKISYVHVITLT